MLVLRLLSVLVCILPLAVGNPLDDYVWKDDGFYDYTVLTDWTYKTPGRTSYLINMTSQRWLTDNDTDRSLWWHFLVVHIPNDLDPQMAGNGFLFIDGGGNENGDQTPDHTDTFVEFTGIMAEASKSVIADLKQIPNEHMTFKQDPKHQRRTEDAIIAYTWRHFLEDPSKPEWLLRMPMTKAAVKAMDTVTAFVNKTIGKNIDNYCVGGASKRGWTTWTTGAVDTKRVKCITPIVMDELNMVKNLHHHYRAYGGWSFAFKDYYDEDITRDLDHPNMPALQALVDPYAYIDRLTMPKLVFSTGGDEFFLPDDSYYYFNDMKGPTYISMLPNAEHSCAGHEMQIMFNIVAFYLSVMKGNKLSATYYFIKFGFHNFQEIGAAPYANLFQLRNIAGMQTAGTTITTWDTYKQNQTLPKASWSVYKTATGGGIDVTVDTQPTLIRAWSATSLSTERRDFRLLKGNKTDPNGKPSVQPNLWHQSEVESIGDMKYRAQFDTPLTGQWRAFFIQMTFPGPGGYSVEFTTQTNIVPGTFPFNDCYMEGCKGTLV